jgi:LysR family transcriptional regulator, glycine cleavage system transcriptional activator
VLFERLHSGLVLTSAGRAYLEPVRQAFSGLAGATAKLKPAGMTALVHVGIHPAFKLSLVRAPLAAFRERELGIAVRITQPAGMHELLEGKVDLVVERGIASHPGYRCDPLSGYRDPANLGWFLIGASGTADCREIRLLRSWILQRGSVVPLRLKSAFRS